MKTIYDIQQILKRFNTYIYTGSRIGDLELMSLEIKELYYSELINKEEYAMSIMLIQSEITKLRTNN